MTKQTRPMTPKTFLYRASGKAANSAEAFLNQHREFLCSGEIAKVTSPILAKLDAKEILPTPCLADIKAAVYGHVMALDLLKAEESLEKSSTSAGSQKPYLATIYNADGTIVTKMNVEGEEKELIKGFDLSQRAKDWIDLRLIDSGPNCYGVMEHTLSDCAEVVLRGDAFARALKAKKSPFMHVNKVNGRLTNQMRVKSSASHFSNG